MAKPVLLEVSQAVFERFEAYRLGRGLSQNGALVELMATAGVLETPPVDPEALHREQLKILELFGTVEDMDSEEEMRAQRKGRRWTDEEREFLVESVREYPLTDNDPRRRLLAEALQGSVAKTGDAIGRDLTQELLDDRREEAAKKGW